jgi:tetratricopeptide (TPR) repeat protein
MQSQNYFEVLGLTTRATSKEVQRAYQDLAKLMHPDKIHKDSPRELRELTEQVFARITQAYNVLGDQEKLQDYKRRLVQGATEEVLKSEALFEKGRKLLETFRYADAELILAKVAETKGHRKDLPVYLSWARLKKGLPKKDRELYLKEVHALISSVPAEDRHSANYFFVKGLFYAAVESDEKAIKNLERAIQIDDKFIEAKRELAALRKRQNEKPTSFLEMDVTGLFRRKKS